MLLFLYGSLMHPSMLARRGGDPALPRRCQPAGLLGWTRVALPRSPWPTLRCDPRGEVCGVLAVTGSASLRRLAAWEGPGYRLTRVVVTTPTGKTAAWTWIAPGGTPRPWKG